MQVEFGQSAAFIHDFTAPKLEKEHNHRHFLHDDIF